MRVIYALSVTVLQNHRNLFCPVISSYPGCTGNYRAVQNLAGFTILIHWIISHWAIVVCWLLFLIQSSTLAGHSHKVNDMTATPISYDDCLWYYSIPFDHSHYGLIKPDGIVAYTKKTFKQLKAENPDITYSEPVTYDHFHGVYVTWENDNYISKHASLTTREAYWEALECLPPCRWSRYRGLEYFHISEATTGNIHTFWVTDGTEYADFSARRTIKNEEIAALWETRQ